MEKVHARLVDEAQRVVDGIGLVEAIQSLDQSTHLTSQQARLVEARVRSTDTPGNGDIAQLSRLRRQAIALTRTTHALGDAVERYFVSYVTSLARPGWIVQTLLSPFDHEIMMITRDVLDSTSDERHIPREILEKCYDRALDSSGSLHADNYFVPLGEASLGRPYDSDYHSEAYYEHQNRLEINEGYAQVYLAKCEHEAEEERRQKEKWIGFWVNSPSYCQFQCKLADVPRYLFRTFDDESLGTNDHHVMASMKATSTRPRNSKIDLLSSLLFVIQGAIWRHHRPRRTSTKVKICIVDTTKFPRGQFARDMPLIKAYRDIRRAKIFGHRLERKAYDNGEYLSQGILHHAGRSSLVSLAQLIEAGLYDLNPEFQDLTARTLWANRVKDLRSIWSREHISSKLELQKALEIARACFENF
ncbi:hypothetical protein BJX65DRAFT_321591 [Aspergillus insuetus]